jgi:hypothetical protein
MITKIPLIEVFSSYAEIVPGVGFGIHYFQLGNVSLLERHARWFKENNKCHCHLMPSRVQIPTIFLPFPTARPDGQSGGKWYQGWDLVTFSDPATFILVINYKSERLPCGMPPAYLTHDPRSASDASSFPMVATGGFEPPTSGL